MSPPPGGLVAAPDPQPSKNPNRLPRESSAEVTSEALQDFYRSRMPRVAGISLLSGLASDLIINARSPIAGGERCWRSRAPKMEVPTL